MAEMVRINKFLSEAGLCSRREADTWILQGRVTVDGVIAGTGMKVRNDQEVCVDGRPVGAPVRKLLYLLNKPRGVVCTSDTRWGDKLVGDLIDVPERLYPIGRLDKESEGLILMTNQGDLLNKILKAENRHEKEYVVRVDRPIRSVDLHALSKGIYLEELDRTTRPCLVSRIDDVTFRMVLTQGLNRQIRRMCEARGYRVRSLKRVRIMNILLGDLPSGAYREPSEEEMAGLRALLQGSSDNTELRFKRNK